MITIEYGLSTYENFLKQLCKALEFKYSKNFIKIPESLGHGFFRLLSFHGGIECLIFNASFKNEIQFHQKKIKDEHLIIRLDNENTLGDNHLPRLQLNKTNRKWIFMAPKFQIISGINILFPQETMQQFFKESEVGIQINDHLNFLSSYFYNEPMDAEYKKWFKEIFEMNQSEFHKLIIYNRIMLISERVFLRYHKKVSATFLPGKFSHEDLSRIKEVTKIFIHDFSERPMSLNQLSKMAAMSASKFKIIFKEIYEQPPHQFFTNQRMNKAHAMILSNRYSLNEIMDALGFEKKSVFKSAYEKQFGKLPEMTNVKN